MGPAGLAGQVLLQDEHGPIGWRVRPCPWLADYGLAECPEPGFPARTRRNARETDGTLWLGSITSRGFSTTNDALPAGHPRMIVYIGTTRPSDVRAWIARHGIARLNVAGNRESVAPGIGARAEAFLARVFGELA